MASSSTPLRPLAAPSPDEDEGPVDWESPEMRAHLRRVVEESDAEGEEGDVDGAAYARLSRERLKAKLAARGYVAK